MAKKPVGKIFVELDLDKTKYEAGLGKVKGKGKKTATDIEKAWKVMGKKSEQTYDQMRANVNKNYNIIKNHAKSTANDIVRAERAKAAKIARINEQQFGKQKKLIDQAKQHWMAYAAAVAGFIIVGKKILTLSMEQEKAQWALRAALVSNNEYTKETLKSYTDFASAIQKVTTFGDEQVLMLMALMKNLGVHKDKLKLAAEQAIGLASATGRGVESMAMYIALAHQGEFTMLRRYIPALKKTTDATEQMAIITEKTAQGFVFAKEMALTFGGRLKQLSNLWNDLHERVGDAIVKNEAMVKLLDDGKKVITAWIDQVELWVKLNDELIAQKTHEAINKIKSSLEAIINTYKALPDGVIGAVGTGILFRVLTGSTPVGRVVTILMLVNTQLEKAGVNMKKIASAAEVAVSPLSLLRGLIPESAKPSFFQGGVPGTMSGAGRGFPALPPRPGVPTMAELPAPVEDPSVLRHKEMEDLKLGYFMENQNLILKGVADYETLKLQKQRDSLAKEKAMQQARVAMYQSAAGSIANTFLQIAQAGGKQSKKMFAVYKAFAMVEAVIAGHRAILQAMAAYPPPWSFIMAGIAGAAAAVQIAMISAAKPPSYETGTDYVPETGLALLHKGEKVTPAGRNKGEGNTYITVKMENPVFQDVATQRQVFAQIAEVIATRVAPGAVVNDYRNDGMTRQVIGRV